MKRRDFVKLVLGATGAYVILPSCHESEAKKTEGVIVNDVHAKLNPTRVHRIEYPYSLDAIQKTIKATSESGESICISGARHSMGAQQFATDGVLIDSSSLNRILNFDEKEGTVEVESGVRWQLLVSYLINEQKGKEQLWGIIQKQSANLLTIGGSLSCNMHGRGLCMKPFVQDIESFVLVDAKGDKKFCSREENPELFRLAVGGYGLFGIVHTVKLRLKPRQKLELKAEIVEVGNLMKTYDKYIDEGYTYGTFLYNPNPKSDNFLTRGIFFAYRPVETGKEVPDFPDEPSPEQWIQSRYLAHADPQKWFENVSKHFLTKNGELSWSDTHQEGLYIYDYHARLDKMLHSQEATDVTTEVLMQKEKIPGFVNDVRENFRKNDVKVIFGDIGVIREDDVTFLSYVRGDWARMSFNIHTVHSEKGIEHSKLAFQRIINMAAERGGTYYPTLHKFVTRQEVESCFPQFRDFLKLKKKYDPEERFQSDWYRFHKKLLGSG